MTKPSVAEILARLIGFPTLSRQSNLALLDYVESLLAPKGIRLRRFASADGTRANLFASIGPECDGGIVLSGHSDVVPVEGQDWSSDPFTLREAEGRYYGRGAVDMKGFVACAIEAMLQAAEQDLKRPLHLALSYDEEIGCLGVRGMIESLAAEPLRPAFCLIGEPTGMQIATGHKGKIALKACCQGVAGHSALAPLALNALHLGAAFVQKLQEEQARLAREGARDSAYDIPYTTIHAGMMRGGKALNIVPEDCEIDFEIRHIMADDPQKVIADLRAGAEAITAPLRPAFPAAAISLQEVSGYPGLETDPAHAVVGLLRQWLGHDLPLIKVAFGTEGGLFSQALEVPALVCGPGHMAQGHRPDEFVEISQIEACRALLAKLRDHLAN